MKDYYQILGVDRNASEEEVKKAFRKIARTHHPDRGGDEKKFKEASEAYAILSDKKRRAEYDMRGSGFNGAGGAGYQNYGGAGSFDFSQFQGFEGFDFGDIFGEMFGGGNRTRERRGRDISIDLEIDFKEAIFGTERRVLITKLHTCKKCRGSGAAEGSGTESCSTCSGKGTLHEARQTVFGTFSSTRTCETCNGKGSIPKTKCATCRGKGVDRGQEEIHIALPKGIENGEMVRMPQQGEAIAGGIAGDLYVKVHVRDDKRFTREGSHIYTTLGIKLTDALLGTTVMVPSIDGDVSLSVPAGTMHGAQLRIKGKGAFVRGSERGDLIVRISIQFPQKLSRSATKLVEDLRKEGI